MRDAQLTRLIDEALEAAGLRLVPRAREQLALWLGALLAERRNLTGVREPSAAVAKHVVEPLAGFEAVLGADIAVPHGPLVDVGSGNGAPGLPIGLVYPDRSVLLLDSRAASVEFLAGMPGLLGAPQIGVRLGRAEEAVDLRGRFAVAVTRAAAAPAAALELALPLLDIGGVLAMWARPPAELRELEGAAEALGGALMPLGAGVELIAAVKTGPTPAGYPRRWAQIRRRPL